MSRMRKAGIRTLVATTLTQIKTGSDSFTVVNGTILKRMFRVTIHVYGTVYGLHYRFLYLSRKVEKNTITSVTFGKDVTLSRYKV